MKIAKIIFIITLITILQAMNACRNFSYEPYKIVVRDYKRYINKNVSTASLKSWVSKSNSTMSLRRIPPIVFYVLETSDDKIKREDFANLFYDTYIELDKGRYGARLESFMDEGEDENITNNLVNAKEHCLDVYDAFIHGVITGSEKVSHYKGNSELNNLILRIKEYKKGSS